MTFDKDHNSSTTLMLWMGNKFKMNMPVENGALFYNYKQFFSVLLLDLVDVNYCIIAGDVGEVGKISDSTDLKNSN